MILLLMQINKTNTYRVKLEGYYPEERD